MARKILITVLAVWLCTTTAHAQEGSGNDPIGAAVIPPDVVMSHQQELGLTIAQRDAILADVQHAQTTFTSAQWKLSAATEKLAALLNHTRVDRSKAVSQLNAVLDIERQIKVTQITLMVEVLNELTPDQQALARKFTAAKKQ